MFKSQLELLEKVIPALKDYSSTRDGILLEGVSSGQGGLFGHVRESKSNSLSIGVIGFFVDCEIELDGVHPRDCCFIGAIEGSRLAKLEFSRFSSRQHGGWDRWAGVGWYNRCRGWEEGEMC